jgi:hypothetical protein
LSYSPPTWRIGRLLNGSRPCLMAVKSSSETTAASISSRFR